MRIRILIAITLLWSWPLAGICPAADTSLAKPAAQASEPAPNPVSGKPDAFFPKADHTFKPVLEDAVVMHSFVLQNRGDAPLEVKEVKTS